LEKEDTSGRGGQGEPAGERKVYDRSSGRRKKGKPSAALKADSLKKENQNKKRATTREKFPIYRTGKNAGKQAGKNRKIDKRGEGVQKVNKLSRPRVINGE